jgi:hypothetical protein
MCRVTGQLLFAQIHISGNRAYQWPRAIVGAIGLLEDFLTAVNTTDFPDSKKPTNLYCPRVEPCFFWATRVVNESSRSEPFWIL